jgi:D-beta-D-heptose 7-phosphate kinase/D-beta-D-heptose 1-phosphate adenosyltransferase
LPGPYVTLAETLILVPAMSTRLIELVENLPRNRVVLVGDFMMDRYLYGNAERLSPEAPVPVLHFQNEEYRLGGAGNVAAGLAALNAEVRVVGVMGADEMSKTLSDHLAACGCDTTGLVCCTGRPTTTKMRLVGSAQHRHPQQMLRLDFEQTAPLPPADEEQVIAGFAEAIEGASIVCIEDYNKGAVTPRVCREVIRLSRERGVPVLVDPANIADYAKYAGATCIKLNRIETHKATGVRPTTPDTFEAAAKALIDKLGLESAVITLDKDGAYLGLYAGGGATQRHRRGPRGWHQRPPVRRRDAPHPRPAGVRRDRGRRHGAGHAGRRPLGRRDLARGRHAGQRGRRLRGREVRGRPDQAAGDRPGADERSSRAPRQAADDRPAPARARPPRGAGRKIVFTNGCFDLIHLGHVKYFRFAKAQGDLLVVGVNTDASIRGLKGSKRPIVNEDDRVEVLQELESIDYLVLFGDETPMKLIEAIRRTCW